MIKNIAKYKAFILVIGMIAGFGIVAQPVLKAYVDYEEICELKKDASSDQNEDSQKENPNDAQISILEAVTPTAQIHFSPLDFSLEDQPSVETPKTNTLVKAMIGIPEKLLKVLFNVIIATNAP